MRAHLVGEKSAGMTAVEIYDGERGLVWSHRWFDNGCSREGYIAGLIEAVECMRNCEQYGMFETGEIDDNGDPVPMDNDTTTGVMLVYNTEIKSRWALGYYARLLGQSSEIIDALMLAGMLAKDDAHEDNAGNPVVVAIFNHLQSVAT